MNFQPRVFTFYSYKGGVGRSMALLNTAYYLHARGRHVLIVDLDLDAPGASGFLDRTNELLPGKGTGDVVDVLSAVVHAVRSAEANNEPDLPALRLDAFLRQVDPEKYAPAIHPKLPRARLDVLAADQARDYTQRLSRLELGALSAGQIAQASDLLRGLLLKHTFPFHQPLFTQDDEHDDTRYDYILVDSRTGLSEIGGLCVGPLSDRLVVLSGLNDQNIVGTRHFLELVGLDLQERSANTKPWDDADPPGEGGLRPPSLGPKPTLLIASPVPGGEMSYKTERMGVMNKELGLVPVKLSYHPQMALMETIFVRNHPDEYLAIEYATLASRVMSMVSDGDEQLMTAMRRWLVQHFRQGNTDSDVSHLIRYLVRSSLSSGDTDFGFPVDLIQHFGVPEEEQEQIRLTQIALAPTDSATANLWLQWADSLDTKEAQLKGEPAALEFLEDKYRKAVELRPDFHEALHNWGVALWNWAKFKKGAEANELFAKACDKFDEALDIHPDSYRSLASFGKALAAWAKNTTNGEAEKLFERAFEKLERALTIKPNDQEALFSLGCLAALQGDTSGAISALERWKNVNSEASKADLDNDSDFDRVRLDPQFERFRESLADL